MHRCSQVTYECLIFDLDECLFIRPLKVKPEKSGSLIGSVYYVCVLYSGNWANDTVTRNRMHRNEGNAKPTGTRSATVSFRKPGDWACITTGCLKTQKICSDFFSKNRTLKFVTPRCRTGKLLHGCKSVYRLCFLLLCNGIKS